MKAPMKVRDMEPADESRVKELRRAYFAQWNQALQERTAAIRWRVAVDGDGIAGVYSYGDAPEIAQRWGEDFYVCAGARGRRAALAMWEDLRIGAAAAGIRSIGTIVHPRNVHFRKALDRRGFTVVAVMMMANVSETGVN